MSPRSMVTPGGSGRVVFLPRFSTNRSISLSAANREQAELMTPLPPMNNTLSFDMVPTVVRAALDACQGVFTTGPKAGRTSRHFGSLRSCGSLPARADMKVVGVVLHPERDCSGAVGSILDWAARRQIQVLGIDTEIRRLACTAEPVTAEELRKRADLVVSLGGDGTMLRAMRLADRQRSPVLGVNLGKLGFLAEVDVPDLADALSAIDNHEFTTEPRLAVNAVIGDQLVTAFNDIAFVRFPGQKTAAISVEAAGRPFVSYAADAIVVATPTGSTAYSFSAGGPIVSPSVEALLVTPAAPHSAYNRGLVVSVDDQLTLSILPTSGRLAVEADGNVAANVEPGDRIELQPRPGAAYVVRLGHTTFYERVRRKLRLTDSAEIAVGRP